MHIMYAACVWHWKFVLSVDGKQSLPSILWTILCSLCSLRNIRVIKGSSILSCICFYFAGTMFKTKDCLSFCGYRILVRTKGTRTSGPKRKHVIAFPSCSSSGLRRQVTHSASTPPTVQTWKWLNLSFVIQLKADVMLWVVWMRLFFSQSHVVDVQ